jgi:WD40 repeat protein
MKKNILCYLLLLFAFQGTFAQSISLFDIDKSSYPNIKAKFYSFDKNGAQIKHPKSELSIFENGINRSIVRVDCPPGPPQKSLSSVLVMDVSYSMLYSNSSATNLELAQAAAISWINALPGINNECAITSFSDYNYANQDFTTDKTALVRAVNNLRLMGGTDYDMALLNPSAGGLKISKSGKYQKVIVFLTDGFPNRIPSVDAIVTEAQNQNCVIYCVTLGMKAPKTLNDIATRTGGQVFENVTTIDQAKAVYQKILDISQGSSPCTIEWNSQPDCSFDSTLITLKINSTTIESNVKLMYGKSANPQIVFSPSKLSINDAIIGQTVSKTLKMTATAGDIVVNNVTISDNKFTITPKNFTLKKGESINLTVSYNAIDDGYHFTKYTIESNSCPLDYYVSGKVNQKKLVKKTLKLTFPNGGETFVVGTDSVITWTGISPNELVRLEYSFDNGNSWKFIDTASGLSYTWKKIPKPTSSKCLVKVIQLASSDLYSTFNIVDKDPIINTNPIPFSKDGSYLLYFTFDKTKLSKAYKANVWGTKTKKVEYSFYLDTIPGYGTGGGSQTTIGNYVGFSPKGDYIAIGYGQRTEIWNYKVNGQSAWPIIDRPLNANNRNGYLTSLNFNSTGDLLVRGEAPNNTLIAPNAYIWDISKLQSINLRRTIPFTPTTHDLISHTLFHPTYPEEITIAGLYGWRDYNSTQKGLCGINQYFLNIGGINPTLVYKVAKDTLQNIPQGYSVVGSIAYNNDGNIIAFKDQSYSHLKPQDFTDTIKIWSKLTSKVEYSEIEHKNSDNLSFSPDDTYFATSCFWDSTVKVWDFTNQSLVKELKHNSKVSNIQFSKDGKYIAIHGWDNGVITLWSIDEIGLQEDVSDATFTIVAPSCSASNINMGSVLISKYKDSVVTGYIRNIGTWKLRVDSLYFRGLDASAFKLISGFPKYDISIGGNKAAEFSFTPRRVGPHSAEIVIFTQSDTLVYDIIGNGIQQSIAIGSTLIDFGQVELNRNKDSLNVGTIKNIGPTSITIDSTKHSFPNDIDFSTLFGGGTFILAPGEERKLNLRFTPSTLGRTSGTLEFYFKGPGSPATVQLFGEGIKKSPSILTSIKNIKTLLCEQSDTVDVTITNDGAATLDISNITVSGSNSSEFRYIGNRTVSILPDSNYQAKVIFTPLSRGDKTAELVIFSNADQDSIFSLQLNGRKNESILNVSSEVNIGTLCPNEEKGFDVNIQNTGNILAPISVFPDSTIETNSLKDSLFVGQQKNLSFTFKGLQNAGPFTRQIKLSDTCGNIYPVTVKGTIISPKVEIDDLSITSIIGSSREGIMNIKNLSSIDITVNSISGFSNPFSLQSPTIPFTLPGNAVQEIKISYLPFDTVKTTQTIFVTGDPCLLNDTVLITGIPASSRAVVMVGNYTGYPGDIIDIPIELTDSQNLNQSGLTSMSIDVAFNPSLLSPRSHTINFINDTLATISIKDVPVSSNGNGKIITLRCDIGLGNAELSELTLLNVKENSGIVPLTIKNGTFKLLGVCYEGGARLVSTSKNTSLMSINPNPSDGMINVSINMLEKGKHTVRILDSRGFLIDESVHDLQQGPMNLQYDSLEFITGMYFIQLQTPTQSTIERFIIQK